MHAYDLYPLVFLFLYQFITISIKQKRLCYKYTCEHMLILSEAPQSLPAIHIASLLIVVQEIDCHVPLFFWGGAYQTSDPCAITRAISHRRYRIGPNNPSHTTSARHKVSATSPLAPGNTKVNQRKAPLFPKKDTS